MQTPFVSLLGIAVILLIALALSNNRRAIRLRIVGAAFALQTLMALLVLRTPWGAAVIAAMARGVSNLLGYAAEGTNFIFGPLASPDIGGNSFAIAALTVIIFFASLVSVLYYLGVMQLIIRWVGGAIGWVTGISRVESLAAAANIFVGQSESPLVVRPYLAGLAPSRLFTLMSVGMAGVAGTILAAYASLLGAQYLPFLLAAAFMSAPGGILMAKIIMPDLREASPAAEGAIDLPDSRRSGEGPAALLPEGGRHEGVEGEASLGAGNDIPDAHDDEEKPANVIMAAAQGAQTGVKLAVAVGAMVLSFVALVALANGLLSGAGELVGVEGLTFQSILGWLFSPVMFLLGIPWNEAQVAGGLFGTKIVLNEFVAFIELGGYGPEVLSPRSRAIVTFSLCGFANIASIAIQIAVIGGLAPNQRPVVARLGPKALAAGSLSNLMSAALAGLMLPM
ncbi:NupC/NupG family nucleoside CNT transporter [Croceicoccus marinus]|jgi:CNT family concentrative nucleoside transporter|uniref:NupC/NupG family nucleoside CNT transporter n=1 Tax=Croceicoccus marinus TaxID=450378 RepID=A0A7G6VSU3_9SPHN|nr:nucleoside transporter C-terminal domain-containing protein [Croceicoccus marinus]QNE04808.1 NupC/NupG family nucleoside CNT transporter [Croceicoccus marinus]